MSDEAVVETPSAEPAPAVIAPEKKPLRKAGLWFLVLALLVVAALATAAYVLWQRVGEMERTLASATERNEHLHAQTEQERRQSQSRLSALSATLRDNREQLRALRTQAQSPRGWILTDVEYLLHIAGQRLNLQRDIGGAVAALRAADERLRAANDPALTQVRAYVSQHVGALAAVPQIDRAGLTLELAGMAKRARALPLRHDRRAVETAAPAAAPEKIDDWRELLAAVWAELKSLVVVRRSEQAALPPAPGQGELLRLNLRLQLEAARLALLQDDAQSYVTSLSAAQDMLSMYFNTRAVSVQKILAELKRMAQVPVQPPLPDISGALQALHELQNAKTPAATEHSAPL